VGKPGELLLATQQELARFRLAKAVTELTVKFQASLRDKRGSERIWKVVEQCDVQIVAFMAWRCLFDDGTVKQAIKHRGQEVLGHLRQHARGLTEKEVGFKTTGNVAGMAQTQAELEHVKKIIANARKNRVYDTKREGIAMNSRMLSSLRAHIRARTGQAVKFSDLARILDAAQRAVHPKTTAKFDPELIRRNIQTFEKTRETLLARAQQK